MSGWDAPTGSWDSRPEPDESGPDEQGYQQGEPTGGYRTARGGEGRLRAGRRSLPGYDQAQNHDQVTVEYDPRQGSGHGQMVRYGQRPADEPASGSGPHGTVGSGAHRADTYRPDTYRADNGAYGSGPQRTVGSGPLSSPPAPGQPSAQDPLTAPGVFGSGPRDPLGSGPQGVVGPGPRDPLGSGPQGVVGYGEQPTAAYRQYGVDDPTRSGWSDAGGQQGYADRPGYGDQPGYGAAPDYGARHGSGQDYGQDYGQSSFAPNAQGQGYDTQPGYGQQGYGQQGYGQPDAYPGAEPSDYPQHGYGDNGFGQDPGVTQAYGTGYAQNGYAQNGYTADSYAQSGAYPQVGGYGQGGGYGQQGFDQPGSGPGAGPGFDSGFDSGFGAPGRATRSRPGSPRSGQRPAQRLAGARMILYLAASVIGVVVIVVLVINLTKTGAGNAAGGSSTPTAGTTAAGGTGSYVLTQAAQVGSFKLNKTATGQITAAARNTSAPVAAALKAKGAGTPGKAVVGIYDLGPVTSMASSSYKGMIFIGYNGTYKPDAVIAILRSHLRSSRVVRPGSHGGEMVCGYDASSGADASECAWVTKTTFGLVQFVKGAVPVKYPGAADLARAVRNAVEARHA